MKPLLTLCLLSLLTGKALSQNCPCAVRDGKVIIVNFEDRSVTTPEWKKDHYNRGDKISICVTHVNPYLYKVVVNGTDSNQVPPAIGPIFSWILDPSNLSSIVSTVATTPLAATASAPTTTTQETTDLAQKITLRANTFTRTMKDFYQTHHAVTNNPLTAIQLTSNDFFTTYYALIQQRTTEISNINSDIESKLYDLAKETDFLYENNTDDATLHGQYLDHLKDAYQAKKTIVDNKMKDIRDDQLKYFNDITAFSDLYEKNKLLKSRDSLIGTFFAASITLLTKMDSTLSINEVLRRKPALLQLKPLSTTYLSLQQFYLKDIKDITVSISPWSDSASKLPSYNTTIQLPVYHHFRFGVGAGFYVSGLGDRQYAIDSTIVTTASGTQDTSYKIQTDGKNRTEFGVSAIVYGAWAIGGKFYLGPSIGTGVTLTGTVKPRLFIGPTLVYGETNQVMLTAGWAIGQSQTLSAAYTNLSETYGSLPANFTKNAINNGFFISVHYSFLNN